MEWQAGLQQLFTRRLVLVAALVLTAVVGLALTAPWVTGFDPNDTAVLQRLKGPSAAHWMGTDELGRDLYARITRFSRDRLGLAEGKDVYALIKAVSLDRSSVGRQ